jgi:tRNA pseudouridine65 synthase
MAAVPIGLSRNGEIRLLFEDDRYLAVLKPAGLLVHKTPIDAHEDENLRDILRDYYTGRLDPVHRLDKPTSGVIFFGKDTPAIQACKAQFESRRTAKEYLALVRGHVNHEGCIAKPLPKGMEGPLKQAQTEFEPLERCELDYAVSRYDSARLSLVRCVPHTGRYHQIRLHMRHFRHPVMGDSQHGDKHQNRAFTAHVGIKGLLLHARRFAFEHPDGGTLDITAALPDRWQPVQNATEWNLDPFKENFAVRSNPPISPR